MSKSICAATVTLHNGLRMPKLGLGTYKMSLDDVQVAMPVAIKAGYRLIDTATIYRNEEAVGEALEKLIADKVIQREDIFVESKLATADQGYEETKRAVELSSRKLKTDYIDLYVVHWPGAQNLAPADPKNAELRRDSWKALEELYSAGKLRAIGVSNYLKRHLEEMKEYASVLPMVNQFELHPAYHPEDTICWCRENNVVVQAYSSLARGRLLETEAIQRHSILSEATFSHHKTVSQVLLRWAWQHDFCIIPKSVTPARIIENCELGFELSEEEMERLDQIRSSDPYKICWDPEKVV